MLEVLYPRVSRYISDLRRYFVRARGRSGILLVTNDGALGSSESELRGRLLHVRTMLVGSSTGYGLLLLHVRVAVTSLRAHGECGGLAHVAVSSVLEFVGACSGVVVLFIHVDVVATGVHSGFGTTHYLGG